MITKIAAQGQRVGGLLRYLYGPGRCEEHVNPHLVAVWDPSRSPGDLEPVAGVGGRPDVSMLARLLEQPVRAGRNPPRQPVWHCSIRNHGSDRVLSDAEWGQIAREMVAGVGLAAADGRPGVRWLAVRHAADHIHVVATLVRQDGETVWPGNERWRCQATARRLERRYGLYQVAPADWTAHRRPHTPEVHKAIRAGRSSTARDELRRRVRAVAATATSESEFVALLRESGLLVRLRASTVDPAQITGYAVALPGRGGGSPPVYFGGGKLAADLTLPRLRVRWGMPTPDAGPPRPPVDRAARVAALHQAAAAAQQATQVVRDGLGAGQAATQATVAAAADLLTVLAQASEGDRPGPLHRAAEHFDRAARLRCGRTVPADGRSQDLRALSRLIALMGQISGNPDRSAALALTLKLALLADAVEQLRGAQHRLHQARDARTAARALRALAPAGAGRVAAPATVRLTPMRTVNDGWRTPG
ncbi:putative mobilization relaxase component [Actinoplanes sp. SE50]|uniref:relaxase/mobilization nuclease domain-containing protein n=1 Tax=unclassified Actinoplanes TaxID=2626549 RepID=UPI00023EBC10|nr:MULTISPECIES: hypothetical protein [unclassified Actinoplanes]AEV86831.1 putative mobilization relaxase component [Actinoplanes sp. SE50/110]ATO85228.1 putative mobilization relaxase component [Actinoplanes sp. SE50]SLM02638.1 mobilization relaxase component [Actinoplanes sp. SE50/110]